MVGTADMRAPSKQRPLNPQQRQFVDLIVEGKSGTDAYGIAYGIDLTANRHEAEVGGSRLMRHPVCSQEIERRLTEKGLAVGLSRAWVLDRLRRVAERSMQAEPVMVFDKVEREMVQQTTPDGDGVWQFDSAGANRALELIGKDLGMFKDAPAPTSAQVFVVVVPPTAATPEQWAQDVRVQVEAPKAE